MGLGLHTFHTSHFLTQASVIIKSVTLGPAQFFHLSDRTHNVYVTQITSISLNVSFNVVKFTYTLLCSKNNLKWTYAFFMKYSQMTN